MPNEMTPLEAAEILENMAEKDFQSDGAHFEADEKLFLAMSAGARAIEKSQLYENGATYAYDVFGKS